jgi:hypothetical protein
MTGISLGILPRYTGTPGKFIVGWHQYFKFAPS